MRPASTSYESVAFNGIGYLFILISSVKRTPEACEIKYFDCSTVISFSVSIVIASECALNIGTRTAVHDIFKSFSFIIPN